MLILQIVHAFTYFLIRITCMSIFRALSTKNFLKRSVILDGSGMLEAKQMLQKKLSVLAQT